MSLVLCETLSHQRLPVTGDYTEQLKGVTLVLTMGALTSSYSTEKRLRAE